MSLRLSGERKVEDSRKGLKRPLNRRGVRDRFILSPLLNQTPNLSRSPFYSKFLISTEWKKLKVVVLFGSLVCTK